MPRALDTRQLQVSHDPNRSGTEFHMQGLIKSEAEIVAELFGVFAGSITDGFTDALTTLTGLDFSSPEAFLDSLGRALVNLGTWLLGPDSPLNALNLFNLVPTNLLGQLNFSNIGETFTNLVTDPLFQIAEAFTSLLDWNHDTSQGHVGPGTAQTTADGATHELLGNLIAASVGQVVNFSTWVKWDGLVGTGNPIALAVTGYNDAGDAVNQTTIASHNTTPTTTDWLNLKGSYTVPTGVTGLRTRLSVSSTATAGTVWFDDVSVNKTQTMFQRLIAGTDPGQILTDDITNLFTGIVTNALGLLEKAAQGDFEGLVSTIVGDVQEGFEDVGEVMASFLDSLSDLNGDNIASGNIADEFVGGISVMLNNIVTGLLGIGGTGFGHDDAATALQANKHALVDHGAGISGMFARMSALESQFAALPISAGGTGSGNADGGLIGAVDTDTFERTSAANLGPLWLTTFSGPGIWATPNSHDATFATTSGIAADCEFLSVRANPDVLRSQTDYQRVTMELSSAATRYYDSLFGTFNFAGGNDIWLRVSDATTSLANITGIRIRWEGDGGLSIMRFVTGVGTLLAGLGVGGIVPPGPGAQLIGEAGVLADGAPRYFRAKIGESIRLEVAETGTASGLGSAFRRWGHGGRAEAGIANAQTIPGGVHFWNGMDQTLT